jgi:hypothetical protein
MPDAYLSRVRISRGFGVFQAYFPWKPLRYRQTSVLCNICTDIMNISIIDNKNRKVKSGAQQQENTDAPKSQ